jgi:hypothetical protein
MDVLLWPAPKQSNGLSLRFVNGERPAGIVGVTERRAQGLEFRD